MNTTYLVLLFLVGVINFLPIIGMLSADKLNKSYGLNIDDRNLTVLLRHRALLFGLIGGLLFYSIFNPLFQTIAMTFAAISMLGYLYFYFVVGGSNGALRKVAYIDILGLLLLLIAVILKLMFL